MKLVVSHNLSDTSYNQALESLVNKLPAQYFFLHPLYQQLWWQHLGQGALQALTFLDDSDQVIGQVNGFLTVENGQKVFKLVGAKDVTDYLDFLSLPEHRSAIVEEFLSYLQKNSEKWDVVKLECVPHNSSTIPFLKNFTRHQQTICTVATLPKTWDEYFTSLDTSAQKQFSRLERKLGEEYEFSYKLVTQNDDLTQAAADFIRLHKASGLEKASFWTPQLEEFFTDLILQLIKVEKLQLYFLELDGERAATLLIFDHQNEFLLYNSGFDAYRYGHLGVGNALILYTLKTAINKGRTRYNFLRGDESYKLLFGTKPEPVFDFILKT